MRLTITLPSFGPTADWRTLLDLGRAADDAGVDRVLVTDHVVMGRNTDAYAWGPFPFPPETPWLEPLTVLAALAGVTQRVRLATGVLVAPLRPAALLAKTVATLDVLAGGRVDLGVGTGWQREEYDAQGLDFDDRGGLLTDTIAACRRLWDEAPCSHRSERVVLDDVFCRPAPAQARVPVWFSGTLHGPNRRRIATLGDGWLPIMGATLAEIAAGAANLAEDRAAASRPGTAAIQAPVPLVRGRHGSADLAATMAAVPVMAAAGISEVQLSLSAIDPELQHPGRAMGAAVAALRSQAGV